MRAGQRPKHGDENGKDRAGRHRIGQQRHGGVPARQRLAHYPRTDNGGEEKEASDRLCGKPACHDFPAPVSSRLALGLRLPRLHAKEKCQGACKPGSVPHAVCSHTSRAAAAIRLGPGLLQSSSSQPGRSMRNAPAVVSAPPLFGLAPGGVCHAGAVTRTPVRSYRTLSPLPDPVPSEEVAGHRRYALCGTFPGVAPGGRYPPPLFRGARTFLAIEITRLPGPLADGQIEQRAPFAKHY